MIQDNSILKKKESSFYLFSHINTIKNKHEYNYENYIIIVDIIDDKLSITIKNKSTDLNLNSDKYQKLYTQKELIEINRVFMMCDKIEDCINIIDINHTNLLISIDDNTCILTVKLDTKELPKNKISDTIIFKIPLLESKNNNNNNINQINNNLKELNIEQTSNNNNLNNISLDGNVNSMNLVPLIQSLISKIDKLTEENKEIKNRLNVLEKNNNELINIIKENRINIIKEKINSDSPSTNISNNNNKNVENENIQNNDKNNNNNYIFDINALSFCAPQDNFNLNDIENEKSPNFLTRVHAKYLKEKTKSKNDFLDNEIKLNKMDIESHEEKNKIQFNLGVGENKNSINEINNINKDNNNNNNNEDDEENYLYNNKDDTEIYDDMNLFTNNGIKKKPDNNKINKFYGKDYEINKNIMCVDENEEEKMKNNDLNNDEEEDVNKSYNLVGVVCLPISRNSSFSSNHSHRKNKRKSENNPSGFSSNNALNLKKNDSRGNDYLF